MTRAELKITYISGGSRDWERKLMIDLGLCQALNSQVALYDIDTEAAPLNEQLGNALQAKTGVVSCWRVTGRPCSAHCSAHRQPELIIDTVLRRDKSLAFQAIFNESSSHLPIDAAWEMFNCMLQGFTRLEIGIK